MAVLTRDELAAAVAALEWIGKRVDLDTVLNKMPAMLAEKKLPKVTAKGLKKAINFLKSKNGAAAQTARIAKGMRIKEWLRVGELEGTATDTKELLEEVCGMLDSACVANIVESNLFRGSDGRYYTVVVEAEIAEANDDFVQDVLRDLYEEGDDEEEDEPARNDGEPGPAEEPEVIEVTVRGEKAGRPFPPAEDPDPRPGPRFGPPPPADEVELEGLPLEPTGKPLLKVLDTSDTPPLKIADILDRVEAEAVAGADAETIARRDFILHTAQTLVESEVTADAVKEAWNEYGAWHLPTLQDANRKACRKLGDAMGMDEAAQTEADQTAIVIALRQQGVTSIDELDDAAELEAESKPPTGEGK